MMAPEANMPRGGVPVIWGDVPTRNKNFTGRDDILDRLREGASSRRTAVLPESDSALPTIHVEGWNVAATALTPVLASASR